MKNYQNKFLDGNVLTTLGRIARFNAKYSVFVNAKYIT